MAFPFLKKKSITLSFNSIGSLGRLGNQLFQYAALKGIANRLECKLLVPNHLKELFHFFKLEHLKPEQIGTSKFKKFRCSNKYFHYQDLQFRANRDLVGYFQSWKYFEQIEKEIREDFSFNDTILERAKELLKGYKNPYFLHVRRGDYLLKKDYHPALDLEYYQKSIRAFPKESQCLIFSDDIAWCKEHFKANSFYIESEIALPNYMDLALMSLCNGGIISNSTFSWWGAWLQQNNTQPILAPNPNHFGTGGWFGESCKHYIMNDLIIDDWIIVK
jgi:hypothetical protein